MTIQWTACGDKMLVFQPNDVECLRTQHRIVGSLIGTLGSVPMQNTFFGLPLLLLPEEVALIVSRGIAADPKKADAILPKSDTARLRCRVFEYLWSKGLYVTSGLKFGGDFLAYPGDPMRFHSHFIVSARPPNDPIHLVDLINMGRLATGVKKTFVLATDDKENSSDPSGVNAFSIQWAGF